MGRSFGLPNLFLVLTEFNETVHFRVAFSRSPGYYGYMKHGAKMLVCLMSGLAFCTAANSVPQDSADNPYQSIIDRNVFSLKPPPPPPDNTDANKPQTLKITLTGITTILGNKRVLMKTSPPPAKPGEGPKTEQSLILTEGQREGDIEVIQIDEKVGSVKVNNGGNVQTLTFEKDGAKLPATTAPSVVPGAGIPIPGLPAAKGLPQPPGGSSTPNFQLPSRVPRLPVNGGQAGNGTFGGAGLGMGTPQNAAMNGAQPSLEEQTLLIEAARQAGGPTASLLPPTAMSPRANVGGQNTPAQNTPGAPTLMLPPLPGQRLPGPY